MTYFAPPQIFRFVSTGTTDTMLQSDIGGTIAWSSGAAPKTQTLLDPSTWLPGAEVTVSDWNNSWSTTNPMTFTIANGMINGAPPPFQVTLANTSIVFESDGVSNIKAS